MIASKCMWCYPELQLSTLVCLSFITFTLCLTCTPKAGRHKFIKISSHIMIFHTRHHHSVADRLSSKCFVRVEYQLQGFHGNQATACCSLQSTFSGDVAVFIDYKWRRSDVVLIILTAFIQNEIPYKTCISNFFCIWKITEFMPTCLRGAVFLRHSVVSLMYLLSCFWWLSLVPE